MSIELEGLAAREWHNIYDLTGIPVGTAIRVQNKGSSDIKGTV